MNEIFLKPLIGYIKLINKVDRFVEKKSGKGIVDRMAEHIEKEEKLKEEKPIKWASKKLLEGTIKGIISGTISSSK